MVICVIDKTHSRSKDLYERLKEEYTEGRVLYLASIDKVEEVATMLKMSKNFGLAKEVEKIWQSYNEAIADNIIDYIKHFKNEEDIVLVNVTSEKDRALFVERCSFDVHSIFLEGAPKSYIHDTVLNIRMNMTLQTSKYDDISANKEESTV